jgi:hypothetical protein
MAVLLVVGGVTSSRRAGLLGFDGSRQAEQTYPPHALRTCCSEDEGPSGVD